MSRSEDGVLGRVLRELGVRPEAILGSGGEATVYAIDADRVARVHHPRTNRAGVERRTVLLAELARLATSVPFDIPTILDSLLIEGRIVTVERRLPGLPLSRALGESSGRDRASLIRSYLEAAGRICRLAIHRPWYGDLSDPDPIRTATFREYLAQRAARSLTAAGRAFRNVDPGELADALPEPEQAALVHMDAFPGNMLAVDTSVTAILDFGTVSIMGDPRLDPLSAAAYLDPPITPTATDSDRWVAHEWLAARGLDDLYDAARRWIAAFWSFARDDVPLHHWCRSVLLG